MCKPSDYTHTHSTCTANLPILLRVDHPNHFCCQSARIADTNRRTRHHLRRHLQRRSPLCRCKTSYAPSFLLQLAKRRSLAIDSNEFVSLLWQPVHGCHLRTCTRSRIIYNGCRLQERLPRRSGGHQDWTDARSGGILWISSSFSHSTSR